ncbi:hypothetical protein Fot_21749 [Forsythia ovata]|uniref:Uncharacterized protein n=1 Tax=Forsythia ovata TaxID=205694 RepID=A0ABD1UWR0_9LAMI
METPISGNPMNDRVEQLRGHPKVPQSPRRGRRSRARMARNLELMAETMLEMQRQHASQTTVLNAYLQQGFMHPAPPVYLPYQPEGYEDSVRVRKMKTLFIRLVSPARGLISRK